MAPQPKTVLCWSARICCIVSSLLFLVLTTVLIIVGIVLVLNVNEKETKNLFGARFSPIIFIMYGILNTYIAAVLIWAVTRRNGKLLASWWRPQVSVVCILAVRNGYNMAQEFILLEFIVLIISFIISSFIIWVSDIYAEELLLKQDHLPVFSASSPTNQNVSGVGTGVGVGITYSKVNVQD